MLLSIHAVSGALIGQYFHNPLLSFILAFASHFILDIIPHGDGEWIDEYKNNRKEKIKKILIVTIADIAFLIILLLLVHPFESLLPTFSVAAGVIGAVLPDCLIGLNEISGTLFKRFHKFHFDLHNLIKYQPSFTQGLAFQIIILGILIWIL